METKNSPYRLGAYLRRLRQEAGGGLSMRALADLAGVSEAQISRVEAGLQRPSMEFLYRIATPLRTPFVHLLQEAGWPLPELAAREDPLSSISRALEQGGWHPELCAAIIQILRLTRLPSFTFTVLPDGQWIPVTDDDVEPPLVSLEDPQGYDAEKHPDSAQEPPPKSRSSKLDPETWSARQ